MWIRRLIGAITFVLTLFVSIANEEVHAPVQSLGDAGMQVLANPARPFLCDSLQANDCFLMFASQTPPESITLVPPTHLPPTGVRRYEPVACSFSLPYHGDRCGPTGR